MRTFERMLGKQKNFKIELVNHPTEKDCENINRLMTQLSPNFTPWPNDEIRKRVRESNTHLFVVRNGAGKIISMATLHVLKTLYGDIGLIHNVVTDKKYRRQGIAERVMTKLIAVGRYGYKDRLKVFELTSAPRRTQARALYEKLGFKQKDTNVFQLKF